MGNVAKTLGDITVLCGGMDILDGVDILGDEILVIN